MWLPRLDNRLAVATLVATGVCAFVGSERLFSHETLTTTVLFDREIVRVLNDHCVMCHARGGPSFPLETYEESWLAGRKMRADVIARHMPPWAAVAGYGHFANDNSLTLRESQFVVSWVEGLGPRNGGVVFTNVADPNARPRPVVRAQPKFGRWDLGDPDLTVPLPPIRVERDHEVGGMRRTRVDLGLTSERRIRAVQFMPGDRRVVRAAVFSIEETGQWIGTWTPWYGFMQFPQGTSVGVQPGAHVLATIYYQPTTEPVVDRGTLGLSFTDAKSNTAISDVVLRADGDVLARATSQRFYAETVLPGDTALVGLWPDLQRGIKSLEVTAKKPDGSREVLLFAKDIPIDWPTPYIFKDVMSEPRGTRLSVVAYYDNATNVLRRGGFAVHVSTFRKAASSVQSRTRGKAPSATSASQSRRYDLRGTVVSIDKAGGKVIVDHRPIEGLMGAMTMAYGVKDGRMLDRLSPGDAITAKVLAGGGAYTLENIAIVPKPAK